MQFWFKQFLDSNIRNTLVILIIFIELLVLIIYNVINKLFKEDIDGYN